MEAFVRQLAALSVLWSLSELLLPEGRQQKMARMTVSALIMAALISGLGNLMDVRVEGTLPTAALGAVSAESYARTALRAAANQVEALCVRLARRAGYEAQAAVYLTQEGAVDHIELALEAGDAPLLSARELAAAIAGQLSIAQERLRVSESGANLQ